MSLRLYNTATRTVEEFHPLVEGRVSIYHCGLTVQSSPHLGHIRKEVVFDVLRRWLTHQGYDVTVVANVTDIDLQSGQSTEYGRLTVSLGECRYPVGDPAADAFAFLTITDTASGDEVFSGWMVASSPVRMEVAGRPVEAELIAPDEDLGAREGSLHGPQQLVGRAEQADHRDVVGQDDRLLDPGRRAGRGRPRVVGDRVEGAQVGLV